MDSHGFPNPPPRGYFNPPERQSAALIAASIDRPSIFPLRLYFPSAAAAAATDLDRIKKTRRSAGARGAVGGWHHLEAAAAAAARHPHVVASFLVFGVYVLGYLGLVVVRCIFYVRGFSGSENGLSGVLDGGSRILNLFLFNFCMWTRVCGLISLATSWVKKIHL